MARHATTIVTISAVLILAYSSAQGDWARFRGPNGSGLDTGNKPAPTTWSDSENLCWKVALPGPGSSSPIVVGDRVFVTCWSGYGVDRGDPGDQEQLRRHLVALDRDTGETIWSKSVEPYLPEDEYRGMFTQHGYASHTPVSDGRRVYVFFGKTGALAFDMEGNQLWQTSVGTGSGPRGWGTASSPILSGNLLIITATAESEALVGLNKETGEEVWREETEGFNSVWGTPVLVPVDADRTDLVIAVTEEIWGLNPATGRLRWYCESFPSSSICASAVAHDGVVYVTDSSPDGGGRIAVRAGGKGDVTKTHVVWSGRESTRVVTPILHEGRLYAFSNKTASCYNAATGDQLFSERLRSPVQAARTERKKPPDPVAAAARVARGGGGRRGGGMGGQDYASPVLAGGKLYFPSRSGDVFVLKPGDRFEQLAVNRFDHDGEDFSATPAVSNGRLFIRSSKHLYCVGVKEDG